MRTRFLLPILFTVFTVQEVFSQKLVRFSNITEFGVAFQVSGTKRTVTYTALDGSEVSNESDTSRYKIPAPRMMSAFGVMIWDLVFIGAGAGYQYQFSENNMPFQHHVAGFGQARLHFAKGRFRPFTDLRLGYNYTMNDKTAVLLSDDHFKWDGLFVEPALGMGFNIGKVAMFNIGLAYQFLRTDQRMPSFDPDDYIGAATRDRQHRLVLNLGFTFK